MLNVAKPDLGSKRQCESCGAKFFDLNKNPITCPKCSVIHHPAGPARGGRAAAADDDEVEADPVAPDAVSLEEAEDSDAKAAAAAVPDDIDLGDDDAPGDTFLEEEEEGSDDVSGLIDGEIEADDEN